MGRDGFMLAPDDFRAMQRALDNVASALDVLKKRLERVELELSSRKSYTQELLDQLPSRLQEPSASDAQLDLFVSRRASPATRSQDL